MRLFLAINFPPDLRDALFQAAAPLRAAAPDIRWTPADRIHLTVKFLGEQPPEIEDRLRPVMDAVAAEHRPVRLVLASVGAFPGFRRARVVWIGVQANPELESLYRDVDAACVRLGLPRELRVFRPHVTIGRVRPGTSPLQLSALALAAATVKMRDDSIAETLDLMESVSGIGGSRYVTRHRSPLARL